MGENRIFKFTGRCQRNNHWDGGCSGESFSGKMLVEDDVVKGICDEMNGFFSCQKASDKRYLYGLMVKFDNGLEGIAFLGLSNNKFDIPYIFIIPHMDSPKSGAWRSVLLGDGKLSSWNLGQVQMRFVEESYSEDEKNKILKEYDQFDETMPSNKRMMELDLRHFILKKT